jgi:hypothetical protein
VVEAGSHPEKSATRQSHGPPLLIL